MRKPLVFILIVILIFCLTISAQEDNESQESVFTQRRQSMVINQLQSRDIIDSEVLQAMLTIPRHQFVDPRIRESAYNELENQLIMITPLLSAKVRLSLNLISSP